MCRVWIDGVPPGRQPATTDCVTARARATSSGGRVIYGTDRNRRGNRDDCTYSQTTNSVGDIIFGRSGINTTNCRDNRGNRVEGGWYPVSRDGNGNTIYERRTRDSNGNLIVQRARRNSDGTLSIFSTRNANRDRTINGRRDRDDDDDQGENENRRGRGKHGKHDRDHDD